MCSLQPRRARSPIVLRVRGAPTSQQRPSKCRQLENHGPCPVRLHNWVRRCARRFRRISGRSQRDALEWARAGSRGGRWTVLPSSREDNQLELLQGLDVLLHSNAPPDKIARWSVHIAERTGAKVIKRPTLIAIQAACRFICKPHLFPSPAHTASASGCDRRRCTDWIEKIGSRISAEPAMASFAPNAAWQHSFQAAVTRAPKGADANSADGTPTCSFDETSALYGLLSLGEEKWILRTFRSL